MPVIILNALAFPVLQYTKDAFVLHYTPRFHVTDQYQAQDQRSPHATIHSLYINLLKHIALI
jgi:hypothetical protein